MFEDSKYHLYNHHKIHKTLFLFPIKTIKTIVVLRRDDFVHMLDFEFL